MTGDSPRLETLKLVGELLARIEARPPDYIPTLAEMEKSHILRTLVIKRGKKTEAARALGIESETIYKKLKRYASEEGIV